MANLYVGAHIAQNADLEEVRFFFPWRTDFPDSFGRASACLKVFSGAPKN